MEMVDEKVTRSEREREREIRPPTVHSINFFAHEIRRGKSEGGFMRDQGLPDEKNSAGEEKGKRGKRKRERKK